MRKFRQPFCPKSLGGRPPLMTPARIDRAKSLLGSGATAAEVARDLGVSIPTVYRYFPARERYEAAHASGPSSGADPAPGSQLES